MRKKSIYVLGLFILFSSALFVRITPAMGKAPNGIGAAKTYGIEMLWNNSMTVYDVAVSKDGNYIAAVNNTGIHYFASTNSTPKWWHSPSSTFISVAISADGEYVVAGDNSGYIHYFNDSRAITDERLSPTWTSVSLGGSVDRGTLDISDDGEYVVVGGTGISLYYFAGCRGRSGSDETPTWSNMFGVYDFRTVHISSDGRYVAAGGYNYPSGGFVIFYKDANATPYPTEPNWYATSSINSSIIDLAVSNDGYAVVAVDITYGTLYYWANATTLSGDPNAAWTNNGTFESVDTSSDGNDVVAGGGLAPASLHFWTNAREREGTQTENWTRLESAYVLDVAISDDGSLIAAAAMIGVASDYKAYFFKSDGTMIGEFDLLQYSPFISMSGDGSITAVAGSGYDSLYVFGSLTDSTPPAIEDVYQQPANDTVHPDDEVMVYANVTDDQSGVKEVTLNYTYTNSSGTWAGVVNMTNLEENIWNATIPAFPYCTNVTYVIIAEDNLNNTITTEELLGYPYKYHVIPEFPSVLAMPLFMIATLLAVLVHRIRISRKTK